MEKELKAKAYDLIVQANTLQRQVQIINQELVKINQQLKEQKWKQKKK